MKFTATLFLIAVFFCSNVLADDGDMGNGGRTCTTNCLIENPQEGDTNTTDSNDSEETTTSSDDSILDFIKEYLLLILE